MSGGLDPGFEVFARERSRALLRFAYLLVGDTQAAEDLLQSALLRTARRWRAAQSAPEAYARRVLTNLATDRWRRHARRPSQTTLVEQLDALTVEDQTEQVLDRAELLAALAQLPPRQRAVVVLRFYEDLSVAETARTLGCSEGTVKSYCNRALSRLRELLAQSTDTRGKVPDASR